MRLLTTLAQIACSCISVSCNNWRSLGPRSRVPGPGSRFPSPGSWVPLYMYTSNKKTFENVTGCRDTRTAKSKETRQGWSHKTVKYTTPLQRSFSIYVYNEKRYVGGLYTSLFCAIIPALFPYFLPFWYPYILLHFQMFFITCLCLFLAAAAHAICHHRAEVGVLTSSRSPCFGIWTILTLVFTLAEESDPSQPFSGRILRQ